MKKMNSEVLGVPAPGKECTDKKCPFHGEINVKRELFRGKVVRKDIGHTATVEWTRRYYVKKYERFEKRRSRVKAHNPICISAEIGAEVLIAKTRPLSKTKHHVILKIVQEAAPTSETKGSSPIENKSRKSKSKTAL